MSARQPPQRISEDPEETRPPDAAYAPSPDSLAPDLAAPTVPLDPNFPLAVDATQLVLYAGIPGEVWARWHLQPDAYHSISHEFPLDGGVPTLLLRLRQRRDDGSAEVTDETRLQFSSRQGDGSVKFSVGQASTWIESDLGLVNGAGGWLLLTRSNRLESASSLGLALPIATDARSVAPEVESSSRQTALPALISDAIILASDPTLAPPLSELVPVFPLSGVLGRCPDDRLDVTSPSDLSPDAASGQASVPGTKGADHANSNLDPSGIAHAGKSVDAGTTTHIPTLRYGEPASRGDGLWIEAELRIHGWAAPNTLIDLFGHRYRVGAGGRFQFLLKVDDPDLLQQALMLHPPPELNDPRNE